MSVYKPAKSRIWQFDFRFQGHRYNGSTGCTSKRDAQRFEEGERRKAALGEKVKPSVTVDDACDAWYLAKGQYLRSKKTVEYQLLNLATGIGKTTPLADVTLKALDEYIARRRAKVSNTSVNREMQLLRSIVNWAGARGYDVPEIAWKETRLKEAAVQTRTLAQDEETRLFAKLPDSIKPIVEFAILSGQRKNEIVTLRWSDVDLVACRATVWAKGQKPHSFPLTPRMVALIVGQPKVCPQVFTYVAERNSPPRADRVARRKGERYPFSAQGWDRKWRKAVKEAGLEGYRFHDNRHTALSRTGRIEIAYVLAGHSDIRTTKRYFHTAEDEVRKAMVAGELGPTIEPANDDKMSA